MALGKESIDVLRYQREQLQINVLDPLQKIKDTTGRCLQRKEVQIIKSFLAQDIRKETLDKATDGEALVAVFDLYYGKDNLKFIERVLSKAKCQDLVEMLQDWESNNNKLVPNLFYKFGFFPLWIKVNYNFNEFSNNRTAIFNSLKKVCAIPTTNEGDPVSDYMVYMDVSLGKWDVLLCVLVPYCARQSIRASLQYEDIKVQLKRDHITGIYFSRIKKAISCLHKKNLAGSDSSIASTLSSDFGELCDPAYEEISNCYDEHRNDYFYSSIEQDYRPHAVVETEYGVETIPKEKMDSNGNYKVHNEIPYNNLSRGDDVDSRRKGYQSVSSASPYRNDNDRNTVPKLVRASYSYINVSSETDSSSKMLKESNEQSYGACFFVDYNTARQRTVYSSSQDLQPIGTSVRPKAKFVSHHSDYAEQLVVKRDENPSIWYQPKPKTHFINNRQEPKQLGGTYSKLSSFPLGKEEGSGERKSNIEKKWPGNHDDVRRKNEHAPGYYGDNKTHYYFEDSHGCYRNKQAPTDYLKPNDQNHGDNQRHGYCGDSFDYHGNTQTPSNQNYEDRIRSYHGNDMSSNHEGDQMDGFMEAEPEPEPWSRLSEAGKNEQAAGIFMLQSTPSGSPQSSSGFFQADESYVNIKADKISRSMPSLYANHNDDMFDIARPRWSDSRRSIGYHGDSNRYMSRYENQTDFEDNVFVGLHDNSVELCPPPYCPPPDYKDTMIRKSYLSLSSMSLDSKRMKVKSPLLSSQSVSSIYKEKELLLSRDELQESIRSAEQKRWEILLEKSKEFLIAAKMGDEEEVKNLLDEDIDVDYKNEFGHTALMVACREGHLNVIQILIAHGADMNLQDKYGKSALHEAAWSGHHQVINPLILNEADVNCVDEEGRTPLQYASLRGKVKVAEVLLHFGADISIINKDGESAVEIANRCRHKAIVKLLLHSTDKKTRKNMQGKIRKQKIQRIKTATSLPNLSKATSPKTLKRSSSRPDMNKKRACVTQ